MERLNLIYCCIFISIFARNTVNCIECYICTTKTNEKCSEPVKNNLETKECNLDVLIETKELATKLDKRYILPFDISFITPEVPLKCLKIVTKVRNEEYTLRGCQIASTTLDLCKKLEEEPNSTMSHCTFCDGNNCNSSSNLTPFHIFLILTAFIKSYF